MNMNALTTIQATLIGLRLDTGATDVTVRTDIMGNLRFRFDLPGDLHVGIDLSERLMRTAVDERAILEDIRRRVLHEQQALLADLKKQKQEAT